MTIDTLPTHWDVIVVGAGIAGSASALRLARRDAKVLLVEKAKWPREKVCGGCINAAALRELAACGITEPDTLGRAYARMRLACGRHEASFPLPTGRAVTRRHLDDLLVTHAIRHGVRFLSATRAQLGAATSSDRRVVLRRQACSTTVSAKLVLDCSGLGDRLSHRSAQDRTEIANDGYIGIGTVLEQAPSFYRNGTLHMASAAQGYVGLVRAEGERISVAAALDPAWSKRAGGPSRAVAAILDSAGFPAWPALHQARWQGTPRLTHSRHRLGDERVLVLGDAAGYVEPFTGEGMGWAMADAAAVEPLARTAITAWREELVNEWQNRHEALLRRRKRVCRAVTQLLRHQRLVTRCLPLVNFLPGTVAPLTTWLNRDFKVLSSASRK